MPRKFSGGNALASRAAPDLRAAASTAPLRSTSPSRARGQTGGDVYRVPDQRISHKIGGADVAGDDFPNINADPKTHRYRPAREQRLALGNHLPATAQRTCRGIP